MNIDKDTILNLIEELNKENEKRWENIVNIGDTIERLELEKNFLNFEDCIKHDEIIRKLKKTILHYGYTKSIEIKDKNQKEEICLIIGIAKYELENIKEGYIIRDIYNKLKDLFYRLNRDIIYIHPDIEIKEINEKYITSIKLRMRI